MSQEHDCSLDLLGVDRFRLLAFAWAQAVDTETRKTRDLAIMRANA